MCCSNNLVAKHDFNRSAVHKDRKEDSRKSMRKQKHKVKYDKSSDSY